MMIGILFELSRALIKKQILDKNNSNYGAIQTVTIRHIESS